MMTNDRASFFGGDDDDLSDFKPKTPPDKAAVKAVAEGAQFRSRDPQALPVAPTKREPRRYRTGRNQQLNLKVTAEAAEAFYALADEKGWVLGEVFERAIIALKRDLEGQGKGDD
jgi:hypothetical protein